MTTKNQNKEEPTTWRRGSKGFVKNNQRRNIQGLGKKKKKLPRTGTRGIGKNQFELTTGGVSVSGWNKGSLQGFHLQGKGKQRGKK